jgi:hypothetical protein
MIVSRVDKWLGEKEGLKKKRRRGEGKRNSWSHAFA